MKHHFKAYMLSFIAVFLVSALPLQVIAKDNSAISVEDPWVRAAPPSTPALGAFMTIHNNSNAEVKLVAADVSGYQRIELHKTVREGEVMKMIKQPFIPVPAKGQVQLKPGSWHVMLIGPESVPAEGTKVELTLHFSDESKQVVHAQVKKGTMPMMKHKVQH